MKFLRTPSLQNTSGQLLLKAVNYFCKKNLNHRKQLPRGVLLNFAKFTVKRLCQSLPFNKIAGLRPQACNFIKRETLAQVFSCEFCEISKNTVFYRTPLMAASESYMFKRVLNVPLQLYLFHALLLKRMWR